MGASVITSEITEVNDEPNPAYPSKSLTLVASKPSRNESMGKKHVHPIEDELTQLIEARDPKYLSKTLHLSHSKGIDLFRNSAMKKSSQTFGLGISESVTLKQALRKLCISQASEMAAIKRLSKPTGVSGSSEAGTIKRLYAAAVVHGSESVYKEHDKMLEISLLSEKASPKSSGSVSEFSSNLPTEESCDSCTMSSKSSSQVSYATASVPIGESCGSCTLSSKSSSQVSYVTTAVKEFKPKIRDVLCSTSEADEMKLQVRLEPPKKEKIKKSELPVLKSKTGSVSNKSTVSPCLVKPTLKNKNSSNKKEGHDKPSLCVKSNKSISSRKASPVFSRIKSASKMGSSPPSASSTTVCKPPLPYLDKEELSEKKPASTPSNYSDDEIGAKRRELSRSREKGECSQSSKSSIGDYSSSTSISDESNQSISSVGIRPHMSNDVRWEAIRHVEMQGRSIALKNFKLLKRLGCGDIGTVYLAELTGLDCLFALKVMDIEFLMNRKKMMRAKAEREILQMLDHPFLPTLYTHFTTDNLSCLVMEYCPGGDLHVLRQKQLGRCFSEPAAKFYVAEVLLALEYLHMLGVVYRDLKPENILVREDGHIMLSDFDLSLRCTVNPALFRLSSVGTVETAARSSGVCAESYCIDPLCLQPSWAQVSCFTPRLTSSVTPKSRRPKSDHSTHVKRLPQLVVEPVEARSNSFVGTHEYLAPEIIKGEGHGSSVDWWTFGIFLYELIFGRTPFKGSNNDETLANVVTQPLKFPENVVVSFNARELIRGLLVKEPENRLGSVRGAAEIKQHPFFTGLNWALIRCATPPEVPKAYDFGIPSTEPTPSPPPPPPKKKEGRCLEFRSNGEGVEFELF